MTHYGIQAKKRMMEDISKLDSIIEKILKVKSDIGESVIILKRNMVLVYRIRMRNNISCTR